MDSYQQRLKRHLAAYRQTRLGLAGDDQGTFSFRGGEAKRYGHILPAHLRWLNLPEAYRAEIRGYIEASGIKLHDGFHHLNSSQALALSLFWPYAIHAPEALARSLGTPAVELLEFEFIADAKEQTNVDVSWCHGATRTYCEVKLTEAEFGAAKADARHLAKLAENYRPVLAGLVDPEVLEPKRFFRDYQLLRNLWLAARPGHERDQVLFLLPEANERPNAQLAGLLPLVGPALRNRVRVVHLEPLLETLAAERSLGGLGWYAEILQEKYVPETGII